MRSLDGNLFFIESSVYQKASSIFWQIVAIAIAAYCCYHIGENVLVITVIVVLLLTIFIISGNHMVVVSETYIEFRYKNPLFPLHKKVSKFEFKEIVSIETRLQFGGKEEFLAVITNSSIISLSTWNRIKINLGQTEKTINTKIYKSEVTKALEMVKKYTNNKIPITTISSA